MHLKLVKNLDLDMVTRDRACLGACTKRLLSPPEIACLLHAEYGHSINSLPPRPRLSVVF